MTRYRLFDVCVDALTMEATLSRCVALIEERTFVQHVVLNAGKVVLMESDGALKEIIRSCDVVSADGMAVVWAGRLLGVPFPERVTGIDLMELLLATCAEREWPVYVLGATQEVLEAFLAVVAGRYPGLPVAGSRNGYFEDDETVARVIRESGARVLVVGMPSPRKECFLWHQRDALGPVFAMGVGGSLDVLSGHVKRAPRWMQRAGLEWAYRFAQEPRRMWKRYLLGNVRFAFITLREFFRGTRREEA